MLLLHVLRVDGVGASLARSQIYSRAVTMVLQNDAFRY